MTHWRFKAMAQNAIARLPARLSYTTYEAMQRMLRSEERAPEFWKAHKILELWRKHRRGKPETALEIGTGRGLTIPLALYQAGVRIVTVDLNRYLREDVVLMAAREIPALAGAKTLTEILAMTGIDYRAPADAGALHLQAASIDLHYSTNVFEHVRPAALRAILLEARRVLRPRGLLIHRIDLADHFAADDRAITAVNFLQFSEARWQRLAGNRFVYQNRLRRNDYFRLFSEVGMRLLWHHATIDPAALAAVRNGLPLDASFAARDPEELATTFLTVVGTFDH